MLAAALHFSPSMMTKLSVLTLVLFTACTGAPPDGSPGSTDPGKGDTGTGDTGDTGGNGSMTLADYFTGLGHAECDDAFTCKATFPTANGTFADAFGASSSACYGDAASYYDTAAVQAEISAGKITFDGSAAASCIAGMSAAPDCATYWTDGADYPAACDTALVGSVADGGACTIDFDCANLASYCTTANKCGTDSSARTTPHDRVARIAAMLRM